MDLTQQIARVKELMQQRDQIDRELAAFKELVAILKPPIKRRKKKTDQPTMKMGV